MPKFRQYPEGGKNRLLFLGEIYKDSGIITKKQPFFICIFEDFFYLRGGKDGTNRRNPRIFTPFPQRPAWLLRPSGV